MHKNKNSAQHWLLSAAYLGVIAVMMACSISSGAELNEDGILRLDDGIVEVQDENGNWTPVAGSSTFELVGELEGTDPWTVAGQEFETNELTQIEEGLEAGDLVRVKGAILEDGTWVAYSIETSEEQTDPIITLIGVVNSVDPWVVNNIDLNVTDETDIQGEITEGMLVRVEILLQPDGTWEVLSIAPLGEPTSTAGCATVVATVVSVNGNQVQFLGWPTTVTLNINDPDDNDQNDNENNNEDDGEDDDENENENEGEDQEEDEEGEVVLSPGQNVSAVICISEDGTILITNITILDNDDDASDNGEKVLVCHKPNSKKGGHTISIASSAVPAHLAHGDTMGSCP
jgi:hypothetical protein